jgi:hypothetical protein
MRIKLNKQLVVFVFGLLLVVGGASLYTGNNARKPTVAGVSTVKASSSGQTSNIGYKGHDGQSALDGLKQAANVQTKQSSLGEYVVAINGNDGGGKKYWMFYVNGQESSVGAAAYVTKSTDNIEWKLQ